MPQHNDDASDLDLDQAPSADVPTSAPTVDDAPGEVEYSDGSRSDVLYDDGSPQQLAAAEAARRRAQLEG